MISGEFSRIQLICDRLKSARGSSALLSATGLANIEFSVGVAEQDDCAVIDLPGGRSLVFGSDFTRGTEFQLFRLGYLNFFDIGYYLIGANLSDVAAMGATPLGITTVIRYDETLTDENFSQIVDGMATASADAGCPIVGGDTGSYSTTVLSAAAVGIVETGNALLRSGARPGDAIFVSGATGVASAALRLAASAKDTRQSVSQEFWDSILRPWRRAEARLDLGRRLAKSGEVTACIDTSDGLHAATDQVCARSNVGARIYAHEIPLDERVVRTAALCHVDPLEIVFEGSVDFELLFTVAPGSEEYFSSDASMIGRIEPAASGIRLIVGEQSTELPGVPWQSQKLAASHGKVRPPSTGYDRDFAARPPTK